MGAGFARLADGGLQFLDSWCYARVAAEMAASGDWVLPTWRGEPFLEKPPLLFWLTALLFRVVGVSEFAARALVGAATAGCVWIVFRLGTRAAGPSTGLLASLLLCVTPMFLKWGRTYTPDPLAALLLAAALACGWRACSLPSLWPAAGALAGLGVLARGAAVAPALAALAYLAWSGPLPPAQRARRWLWVLAACAACAALALPWHVMVLKRAGPAFVQTYLGTHTLERVQRNLIDSPRVGDPLYYAGHLARTGWPVLPWLVWGLARLRRAWRPAVDPAGRLDRALILYLAAQALMLGLVASRSPRYLLPLYPALALLGARGLAHGLGERGACWMRRGAGAAAALGALAVAVWPAPVGTPRGEPFRALARAVEREGGKAARVEVAPGLVDPWFERAYWFYLGRSPRAPSGAARGSGTQGGSRKAPDSTLRVQPAAQAEACEPPGCRVVERAGPYVLTVFADRRPPAGGK